MSTKSKVAVVKGDNTQKMVEKALNLLGDLKKVIPPGKKIILIGLSKEANDFYKELAAEQIFIVKDFY